MNKTKTATFRLTVESINELSEIAKITERKKNWLVQKAIDTLIKNFKTNKK